MAFIDQTNGWRCLHLSHVYLDLRRRDPITVLSCLLNVALEYFSVLGHCGIKIG